VNAHTCWKLLRKLGWMGVIILLSPLLLPSTVAAATSGQEPGLSQGNEVVFPLSYFLGGLQQATFHNVQDQLVIPVSLSGGQEIRDASLQLQITPSAALDSQSWLSIAVNGLVVGQSPLSPGSKGLEQKFSLPARFFHTGYNEITLQAVQHYTQTCEFSMAPQLWSQVNLDHSSLRLRILPQPWKGNLADLSTLFTPSSLAKHAVISLFLPRSEQGLENLTAAALAVEGVALRYQYLPTQAQSYPLSAQSFQNWLQEPDPIGPKIALFLGSQAELGTVLGSAAVTQIPSSPTLQLLRWQEHPNHIGIALVGSGPQLTDLASAFAEPKLPLPPLDRVQLTSIRTPRDLELPFRSQPFEKSFFDLQSLGFTTATQRGTNPQPFTLRFWNGGWERKAQLRLHLAYAAGMSTQSALNIEINGVEQNSIPLNNPDGGRYADYAVTIAPTMMHPGWNQLVLQPVLIPQSNGGECRPFFPGNLWVTVYDDSTFQWMTKGASSQQPDLAPLADAAYPFAAQGDTDPLTIQLSAAHSPEVNAALSLLGKLAQRAGHPFTKVKFLVNPHPEERSNLYIGAFAGDQAWSQIPGGRGALQKIRLPVGYQKEPWSVASVLHESTTAHLAQAQLQWQGSLQNLAFLRIWRSDGLTHLLLTTGSSQGMVAAANALIDYGLWGQLQGTLAYWKLGDKHLESIGLTQEMFRNFGVRGGMAIWVSLHPWISLLVILLLGVLFVLATRYALRVYARRKKEN